MAKSRSEIGKSSRNKGKAGERELAKVLRSFFPMLADDLRRTQQFCGKNNNGNSSDVVGLPGIHIECKRVEKLNIYDAINQAVRDSSGSNNLPAVFHRKNGKEWLVTMPLKDWVKIYESSEVLTRES